MCPTATSAWRPPTATRRAPPWRPCSQAARRRALARFGDIRPLQLLAGLVGTAGIVAMVVYSLRLATAAPATRKLLVPSGRHVMPAWMGGVFRGHGVPLSIDELIRLIITISVL